MKRTLITQYLKQEITLDTLQATLGLSNLQALYLQSEFNNYVAGDYGSIDAVLESIKLHLDY